jgi:hypothetical protein
MRSLAIAGTAILALILTALPANAADSPSCQIYARTAVSQAEKNLALGCGYNGPRWSLDEGFQYSWCRGQPYGLTQSEINYRNILLGRCNGNGVTSRTYTQPKLGGLRLDWCLTPGHGCGAPAATAFCQSHSLRRAVAFTKASNIGSFTRTRSIGSGTICKSPDCDGFAAITCVR